MTLPISSVQRIIDALLGWYDANARALPWRTSREPYHIWISEVMLQQTQVATVIPYYERFLEAFPTVEALAAADQDQVNKRWEGLGYYSRAAHLKAAAEALVADHGGELPDTAGDLIRLPGIGPYTAGAIASIAFGERTPAVDGNVMRILSRFTADETPVNTGKSRAHYTPIAANLLPAHRPGDFNQALMDLGAMICTPKAPNCPACPWQAYCAANKEALQGDLPKREKKAPRKIEAHTVFVLRYNNKVYVRRRPAKGLLAGLWEFPYLPVHLSAGEAKAQLQEKGFCPTALRDLGRAKHLFTHLEWRMQAYMVTCASAPLGPEGAWVDRPTLIKDISLPGAFAAWRQALLNETDF